MILLASVKQDQFQDNNHRSSERKETIVLHTPRPLPFSPHRTCGKFCTIREKNPVLGRVARNCNIFILPNLFSDEVVQNVRTILACLSINIIIRSFSLPLAEQFFLSADFPQPMLSYQQQQFFHNLLKKRSADGVIFVWQMGLL